MWPCDWCGERLSPASMVAIPLIGGDKPTVHYHRECHMRQITGSLAHIERRCGCYVPGATDTDPPEMTKRQAAKAAVAAWEKYRCVST